MARMVNSSYDMLSLVAELNERRIRTVCGKLVKRRGGVLGLSQTTINQLKLARKLHRRYRGGKYQHSESEVRMLKDLMDWLVATHAENNGQTPREYPFNPKSLEGGKLPGDFDRPLNRGPGEAYHACIERVHAT